MSAQHFFSGATRFAVVGASADRNKYGNKVLRWYQDRKMTVTPINPKGGSIEGVNAASRLSDMVTSETAGACAVSIITPPAVTTTIVQEAYSAGITRIWMQPGSESPEAVSFGKEHNMTVVHDYCILVSGDQAMSQASKM
ncbi:TPA: hypothetical protein ACH3X3_001959 [Trebouxia sp. C0006]